MLSVVLRCSFCADDGAKLTDGIIESGMMEPHMMDPTDGSESVHFDRANGDDLGDNQEMLNDRCAVYHLLSTQRNIHVINIF